MKQAAALALLSLATLAQAAPLRHELLDDFRDATRWKATASDQVKSSLRRDADGSLCLDYDFAGVSGYAVMRRELPMDWPRRFELRVQAKAAGGVNHLQFKLVDASGDNVWWISRPDATLPTKLQPLKLRSREISFAWGPSEDKALKHTQALEFVVAAGRDGGKGSLCLARLALAEREPEPAAWPEPKLVRSGQRIDIDLGLTREFNGIRLDWPTQPRPLRYALQASDDGRRWRTLHEVDGGRGGPQTLFLPDSETRLMRLQLRSGRGLPGFALRDAMAWPTLNAVIAELAKALPPGELPRSFAGQQSYWALVGVDGGAEHSALIDEDGALELGRGGPSLEPAVQLGDGRIVTWPQAQVTQTLRDGQLPLYTVRWQHEAFELEIEASADGTAAAPKLLARYTLRNRGGQPQKLSLLLAARPWQVNPPQQFLATPGGVSPVRRLRADGSLLRLDDRPPLRFSEAPTRSTALPFDAGLGLAALAAAPPLRELADPQSLASALLRFDATLAPGESRRFALVAPLAGQDAPAPFDAAAVETRLDAAAAAWRARLQRVGVELPPSAQPLAETLRISLAHLLMSREGPALRPGTRSYGRSWIRDGAMMAAALVRLGEADVAREFVDWFGEHVYASGKVPCCVDKRGADPVVENDSHGQYLFAVAEVWRFTHDTAFLQRHWPRVQRVVVWMEALRQSTRSEAMRATPNLFGLMPPSISHEGYSDKPAYSYWDDFWALRGYKDAVQLAQAASDAALAQRWAGARDEFGRELAASIEATARQHGIGSIAGAADRGDFDATSTTVALNPAQANVPLLAATFERYLAEADARSAGRRAWKDYTPYELRNVGALLRLGRPEPALALLDFFFRHQRPAGWRQWAEVVLPDAREVRFLGDMPHAWVSSDYIRSLLDVFAWEREADGALLLGAGLVPAWLQQGAVGVRGLATAWGTISWRIEPRPGGWVVQLPTARPEAPGGLRLQWPPGLPLPRAMAGEREIAWQGRELPLPAGATEVILWTR